MAQEMLHFKSQGCVCMCVCVHVMLCEEERLGTLQKQDGQAMPEVEGGVQPPEALMAPSSACPQLTHSGGQTRAMGGMVVGWCLAARLCLHPPPCSLSGITSHRCIKHGFLKDRWRLEVSHLAESRLQAHSGAS